MITALLFGTTWFLNLATLITLFVVVPELKVRRFSNLVFVTLALAIVGFIAVPLVSFLKFPLIVLSVWLFNFFGAMLVLTVYDSLAPTFSLQGDRAVYLVAGTFASINWLAGIILNLAVWL